MNNYDSNQPYIFVSYAHKDSDEVTDIIRHLQEAGFRIWYDTGIEPGSEWDENIAAHVKRCEYFVAFVSKSYLASGNCKDELNYARDLDKKQLLVYLEEAALPDGMAMRMNRLQAILWYQYTPDKIGEAYDRFFMTEGIAACRIADGEKTDTHSEGNHEYAENRKSESESAADIRPASEEDPASKKNPAARKRFLPICIIAGVLVIAGIAIALVVVHRNSNPVSPTDENSVTASDMITESALDEENDSAEEGSVSGETSSDEVKSDETTTGSSVSDAASEDSTSDTASEGSTSDPLIDNSTIGAIESLPEDESWEVILSYTSAHEDWSEIVPDLEALAEQGDGNACAYMASYYAEHGGQDEEQAIHWCGKGMDSYENGYCAYLLSYFYYTGAGVFEKPDYISCLSYVDMAILLGESRAAYYSAEIYYRGDLGEANYEKAKTYAEIGAECSDPALASACKEILEKIQ